MQTVERIVDGRLIDSIMVCHIHFSAAAKFLLNLISRNLCHKIKKRGKVKRKLL